MKFTEALPKGFDPHNMDCFYEVKCLTFHFLIPLGMKFKCVQCGNCCRSNTTPLTKGDITRINAYLKKMAKFNKYKGLVNLIDSFYDFKGVSEESHSGYYIKKVKCNQKSVGGVLCDEKCIFLRNSKCLIYKARPNLCEEYPYHFLPLTHIKKQLLIGFMSEGQNTGHLVCNGFHFGVQRRKEIQHVAVIFTRSMKEIMGEMGLNQKSFADFWDKK